MDKVTPEAMRNYIFCATKWRMRYKKPYVAHRRQSWTEPALAKCDCGEEFYLVNQYLGACQCDKCGKWYSLNGDEFLPTKYWGRDTNEIF